LGRLWLSRYDDELAREEPSRVTANVAGEGWMCVLSGPKTLLETGKPLA
jgi:hypothetical protein